MNFIKDLIKICRQPSSIPQFVEKPLWKVIFYYVFLALVLAIFFSFMEGCSVNKEIRQGCLFIFEKTGGFRFSEKGLTTLKTPDERKEYEILTSRGKMRIDYLPQAVLTAADMDTWEEDTLYGVILLRNAVLSWTKYNAQGSAYMVMYASLEKSVPQTPAVQILEKEAMSSLISKVGNDGKKPVLLREELEKKEYTNGVALSRILEGFASFGNLCMFFIQYVALGLFTIVFFILIQLFRMGPDGKRLSFRTNCSITMYAALPALLAGAVLQAMHIPFLDFQNVFLLVFFIYDILGFNAFYKSFRKGNMPGSNGEKDNEDDEKDDDVNKDKE